MTMCPHGDHPACCVECIEGTPPERPNPPSDQPHPISRAFPAGYSGQCPACNLAIHEGQPIRHMSDATYRHEACA